jgi:hypothetical protein
MLFSISSVWRGNGCSDAGRPVFSLTYIDSRRIDRIQPQQNRRQFTKRIVTSAMETRTNLDAGQRAKRSMNLMLSATLFLLLGTAIGKRPPQITAQREAAQQ